MTKFIDAFSEDIWRQTYKDHKDVTVDDNLRRVAKAIASIETADDKKKEWEEKFYDMLSDFKGTCGGRTYANAGTEWKGTTLLNCFSAGTLVLTDSGTVEIQDLVGKTVNVLNKNGDFVSAKFSKFGKQRLFQIEFENGEVEFATADHNWWITKPSGGTKKVKTTELVGKRVPLQNAKSLPLANEKEFNEGCKHGLIFGDGNVYTDYSTGEKFSCLNQFHDSRHLVRDIFGWAKSYMHKGDQEGIHCVDGQPEYFKYIPVELTRYSISYLQGFIAGAIASDGCVDSRGSVSVCSSNKQYLLSIRDICSFVGIPTVSVKQTRSHNPFDPEKKSELWTLSFVKSTFYNNQHLVIKNSHKEKIRASSKPNSAQSVKVVSVLDTGRVDDVYCCEEPVTHTFTIGKSLFLTCNCFVSPRSGSDLDSLEKIIEDLRNQSFTLKSEGGWGQNFSWIRPRGAFIHGVGVETPGAVKYMELYDKASEIITSGSGKKSSNNKAKGKIRKGAMMGVLDVWHPDIIEFITSKQQASRLTKFNISVNCTDEFMNKLVKVEELKKAGQPFDEEDKWVLRYPETSHPAYKNEWKGHIDEWEKKGYPVVNYQTISALWLWNLVMESTYNRAEPGVLFLDRANDFNPANYIERISATNPCGEQTLAPGGVCCLGSMNLTQFVKGSDFDYEALKKYTGYMVRFLDNVNEYSNAPLPEYVDSMRNKRRIGIGIMGWGSALFMLGVRFASDKANAIRDKVMLTVARTAYESSIDLAIEKGMFAYCDPVKHAEGKFVNLLGLSDEYITKLMSTGIRNSSLLSIQPTGNTGVLANVVSGGLEPIFMPEYIRTVIVNAAPEEIAADTPKWYEGEWKETSLFKFAKEGDEEILKGVHNGVTYKIDKNRGLTREVECKDFSVRYLEGKNKWDPAADYVVTALAGLTASDHLSDLIGFTKYIDSAASKTINLPHEFTFESFKDIYMTAYKAGHVKGVTTYRAGTMTAVLSAKEDASNGYDEEVILDTVKMPDSTEATMKTLKAEGRKWYMTVVWNESKSRPFALFVHTNHHEKSVTTHDAVEKLFELAETKNLPNDYIEGVKVKVDNDNNATKITRVISLLLRHGVAIKNIVNTLDRVENVYVGTFLFQIKKYLSTFIKNGEKVENEKCLECGATTIVYAEGCKVCRSCGASKCS